MSKIKKIIVGCFILSAINMAFVSSYAMENNGGVTTKDGQHFNKDEVIKMVFTGGDLENKEISENILYDALFQRNIMVNRLKIFLEKNYKQAVVDIINQYGINLGINDFCEVFIETQRNDGLNEYDVYFKHLFNIKIKLSEELKNKIEKINLKLDEKLKEKEKEIFEKAAKETEDEFIKMSDDEFKNIKLEEINKKNLTTDIINIRGVKKDLKLLELIKMNLIEIKLSDLCLDYFKNINNFMINSKYEIILKNKINLSPNKIEDDSLLNKKTNRVKDENKEKSKEKKKKLIKKTNLDYELKTLSSNSKNNKEDVKEVSNKKEYKEKNKKILTDEITPEEIFINGYNTAIRNDKELGKYYINAVFQSNILMQIFKEELLKSYQAAVIEILFKDFNLALSNYNDKGKFDLSVSRRRMIDDDKLKGKMFIRSKFKVDIFIDDLKDGDIPKFFKILKSKQTTIFRKAVINTIERLYTEIDENEFQELKKQCLERDIERYIKDKCTKEEIDELKKSLMNMSKKDICVNYLNFLGNFVGDLSYSINNESYLKIKIKKSDRYKNIKVKYDDIDEERLSEDIMEEEKENNLIEEKNNKQYKNQSTNYEVKNNSVKENKNIEKVDDYIFKGKKNPENTNDLIYHLRAEIIRKIMFEKLKENLVKDLGIIFKNVFTNTLINNKYDINIKISEERIDPKNDGIIEYKSIFEFILPTFINDLNYKTFIITKINSLDNEKLISEAAEKTINQFIQMKDDEFNSLRDKVIDNETTYYGGQLSELLQDDFYKYCEILDGFKQQINKSSIYLDYLNNINNFISGVRFSVPSEYENGKTNLLSKNIFKDDKKRKDILNLNKINKTKIKDLNKDIYKDINNISKDFDVDFKNEEDIVSIYRTEVLRRIFFKCLSNCLATEYNNVIKKICDLDDCSVSVDIQPEIRNLMNSNFTAKKILEVKLPSEISSIKNVSMIYKILKEKQKEIFENAIKTMFLNFENITDDYLNDLISNAHNSLKNSKIINNFSKMFNSSNEIKFDSIKKTLDSNIKQFFYPNIFNEYKKYAEKLDNFLKDVNFVYYDDEIEQLKVLHLEEPEKGKQTDNEESKINLNSESENIYEKQDSIYFSLEELKNIRTKIVELVEQIKPQEEDVNIIKKLSDALSKHIEICKEIINSTIYGNLLHYDKNVILYTIDEIKSIITDANLNLKREHLTEDQINQLKRKFRNEWFFCIKELAMQNSFIRNSLNKIEKNFSEGQRNVLKNNLIELHNKIREKRISLNNVDNIDNIITKNESYNILSNKIKEENKQKNSKENKLNFDINLNKDDFFNYLQKAKVINADIKNLFEEIRKKDKDKNNIENFLIKLKELNRTYKYINDIILSGKIFNDGKDVILNKLDALNQLFYDTFDIKNITFDEKNLKINNILFGIKEFYDIKAVVDEFKVLLFELKIQSEKLKEKLKYCTDLSKEEKEHLTSELKKFHVSFIKNINVNNINNLFIENKAHTLKNDDYYNSDDFEDEDSDDFENSDDMLDAGVTFNNLNNNKFNNNINNDIDSDISDDVDSDIKNNASNKEIDILLNAIYSETKGINRFISELKQKQKKEIKNNSKLPQNLLLSIQSIEKENEPQKELIKQLKNKKNLELLLNLLNDRNEIYKQVIELMLSGDLINGKIDDISNDLDKIKNICDICKNEMISNKFLFLTDNIFKELLESVNNNNNLLSDIQRLCNIIEQNLEDDVDSFSKEQKENIISKLKQELNKPKGIIFRNRHRDNVNGNLLLNKKLKRDKEEDNVKIIINKSETDNKVKESYNENKDLDIYVMLVRLKKRFIVNILKDILKTKCNNYLKNLVEINEKDDKNMDVCYVNVTVIDYFNDGTLGSNYIYIDWPYDVKNEFYIKEFSKKLLDKSEEFLNASIDETMDKLRTMSEHDYRSILESKKRSFCSLSGKVEDYIKNGENLKLLITSLKNIDEQDVLYKYFKNVKKWVRLFGFRRYAGIDKGYVKVYDKELMDYLQLDTGNVEFNDIVEYTRNNLDNDKDNVIMQNLKPIKNMEKEREELNNEILKSSEKIGILLDKIIDEEKKGNDKNLEDKKEFLREMVNRNNNFKKAINLNLGITSGTDDLNLINNSIDGIDNEKDYNEMLNSESDKRNLLHFEHILQNRYLEQNINKDLKLKKLKNLHNFFENRKVEIKKIIDNRKWLEKNKGKNLNVEPNIIKSANEKLRRDIFLRVFHKNINKKYNDYLRAYIKNFPSKIKDKNLKIANIYVSMSDNVKFLSGRYYELVPVNLSVNLPIDIEKKLDLRNFIEYLIANLKVILGESIVESIKEIKNIDVEKLDEFMQTSKISQNYVFIHELMIGDATPIYKSFAKINKGDILVKYSMPENLVNTINISQTVEYGNGNKRGIPFFGTFIKGSELSNTSFTLKGGNIDDKVIVFEPYDMDSNLKELEQEEQDINKNKKQQDENINLNLKDDNKAELNLDEVNEQNKNLKFQLYKNKEEFKGENEKNKVFKIEKRYFD